MSLTEKIKRIFHGQKFAPPAEPEPGSIYALINMAYVGQAIYVLTKLGIADHLFSGPKTAGELAVSAGADESYLNQVLRAAAGFGVFAVDDLGKYRLTKAAEPLMEGKHSWLRNYVLFWGEKTYATLGHMFDMVKSGDVAFRIEQGKPGYEYFKEIPEASDAFVDFMSAVTDWQRIAIVKAIDFDPYKNIVDIGGNSGSLMTAILLENPLAKGVIFDQPHMEEIAAGRIRSANLQARCHFVGGSFFKEVPPGADLYIIKHVLHDWPDRDAANILKNICRAMQNKGKLIIIEGVLDERNGVGRVLKMRDLEQMVMLGGKVRTRREFESLLSGAGLILEEIRLTEVFDACLLIAGPK